MGSPVSPIIANLYMENFESQALENYTGDKPSIWYRYVDDTFVILKTSEVDNFFSYINRVDPFIQFTQEGMNNDCLAFLDCSVSIVDGHIQCKVYRKPTHTNQYLLFDSHHPLSHKYSVVRTLYHRADTIVTDTEEKSAEKHLIDKSLTTCGYPNWAIKTAIKPRTRNNTNADKPRTSITFPYVSGTLRKPAKNL